MLKVFGCDAWRLNHLHRSSSFEPRAIKGIYVGISATHKAWLIYDLKSKKLAIIAPLMSLLMIESAA